MTPTTLLTLQRSLYERAWIHRREMRHLVGTRIWSSISLVVGAVVVTNGDRDLTKLAFVVLASVLPTAILGARLHVNNAGSFARARELVFFQIGALQVVSVAATINSVVDRFVVAAVFGVSSAGAFEPASRVANLEREVMGAVTQVHVAELSGYARIEDYADGAVAERWGSAAVRRMALSAAPVVLVAPIIPALLGPRLGRDVAALALLLSLGVATNQLASPLSSAARGLGMADLEARYSLVSVVLNIAADHRARYLGGLCWCWRRTALALAVATAYFARLIIEREPSLRSWISAIYGSARFELGILGLAAGSATGCVIVGPYPGLSMAWVTAYMLVSAVVIAVLIGPRVVLRRQAERAHGQH